MANLTKLKREVRELRATQQFFENTISQTENDKENALRYKAWADGLEMEISNLTKTKNK